MFITGLWEASSLLSCWLATSSAGTKKVDFLGSEAFLESRDGKQLEITGFFFLKCSQMLFLHKMNGSVKSGKGNISLKGESGENLTGSGRAENNHIGWEEEMASLEEGGLFCNPDAPCPCPGFRFLDNFNVFQHLPLSFLWNGYSETGHTYHSNQVVSFPCSFNELSHLQILEILVERIHGIHLEITILS